MSVSEGYARRELLAEPDWLWEHRGDPGVRTIDCGRVDGYKRAHVPGAVRLAPEEDEAEGAPPAQWVKDPSDPVHVMPPEPFADRMARLGVSDDTTVVVYDDYNGSWASRLWWVLAYYGHADAKLLNGGWQRWVEEGRPVTFRETVPGAGRFTATRPPVRRPGRGPPGAYPSARARRRSGRPTSQVCAHALNSGRRAWKGRCRGVPIRGPAVFARGL